MTATAWVRKDDNTYGQGRFPFGVCEEKGCIEAACHRAPGNDNGHRYVCRQHLPKGLLFSPFLGQQEKLWLATQRRVLGGGGAGGSKTYCGARLWMKQYFPEQARYIEARKQGEHFQSKGWAIFFRRTVPEFIAVWLDFKTYAHKIGRVVKWDEEHHLAIFENGYKVQFGGMEHEDNYLKFYGAEYTLIVFDEATQFTKKQIQELDGRLRCADEVLDKQVQLYLLTNPVGGATKAWLRKTFVKRGEAEVPLFEEFELADGRKIREWQVYIPCNLYDNPTLVASGRYEANLMSKGHAYRRAMLENDWDVDEGSWVGDDWDPRVHVVRPHPIPKHWPKFKCGDYGKSSRTAIHWFAVDPEGSLVCYRSWSCRGLTAREVGMRIKVIESSPLWVKDKKTGERFMVVGKEWDEGTDCSTVLGPMDAALWATSGEDGPSRGEILEEIGCGFYPSDKGPRVRHDAADQIVFRLRERKGDPFNDNGVQPGLRFFRGTTETKILGEDGTAELTGPIHTIPVLPADPKDPDVPDTRENDHDWDALAYGVMTRQVGAIQEREPDNVIDFPIKSRAVAGGKIGW